MPRPPWERAGTRSEGRTTSRKSHSNGDRRPSTTPRKLRRSNIDDEAYRFSSPEDDEDALPQSPSKQPLKEARLQSKNNLRLAWESIFERYSQGHHLAAGKDDVFDFGTGQVVEDAGFLDDFVVHDEDHAFAGRSIEIGDFGLPGAMGMNELTESSCSEDEEEAQEGKSKSKKTPVRSLQACTSSTSSESESEALEATASTVADSEDDMRLGKKGPGLPEHLRRASRTGTTIRDSLPPLSRSASAPDTLDGMLSSSSDDELGTWHYKEAPPSEHFKKLRRLREDLKEDLREFTEAEMARQRKDQEERIKRERTCTPLSRSRSTRAQSRLRTQSLQPTGPLSAPSSCSSTRPSLRVKAETPVPSNLRWQHPTPPPSFSNVSTQTPRAQSQRLSRSASSKPNSAGSGFRLSASKPLGRSYSLATSKPSSAASVISSSFATSAIPLQGHYSNTLYNQAIAGDDDTSEDEIDIIATGPSKPDMEISRIPWHEKGKERAKVESSVEPQSIQRSTSSSRSFPSHLPSPAPSRSASPRKRSPTFFANPTTNRLTTPASMRLVPVVEIIRSSSRPPINNLRSSSSSPGLLQGGQLYPHTTDGSSRPHSYCPKQSSPLKDSFHSRLRSPRPTVASSASVAFVRRPPVSAIAISSDEEEDLTVGTSRGAPQDIHRPAGRPLPSSPRPFETRSTSISPTKRRYSSMSDTPMPGRFGGFKPPRASGTFKPSSPSSTPSRQFADMQVATVKSQKLPEGIRQPASPVSPIASGLQGDGRRETSFGRKSIPWPTPPLSGEGKGPKEVPQTSIRHRDSRDDEDVFKAPTAPRSIIERTALRDTADKPSFGHRDVLLPQGSEGASESEDDELLLVSPNRPAVTKIERATPSPFGEGFIRSDTVDRSRSVSVALHTRYRSISRLPARQPRDIVVTKDTAEQDSDDELAI